MPTAGEGRGRRACAALFASLGGCSRFGPYDCRQLLIGSDPRRRRARTIGRPGGGDWHPASRLDDPHGSGSGDPGRRGPGNQCRRSPFGEALGCGEGHARSWGGSRRGHDLQSAGQQQRRRDRVPALRGQARPLRLAGCRQLHDQEPGCRQKGPGRRSAHRRHRAAQERPRDVLQERGRGSRRGRERRALGHVHRHRRHGDLRHQDSEDRLEERLLLVVRVRQLGLSDRW